MLGESEVQVMRGRGRDSVKADCRRMKETEEQVQVGEVVGGERKGGKEWAQLVSAET